MCLEDIRLGRKIAVVETNYIVGAAQTILCDDDPSRVMLTFWPSPTDTLILSSLMVMGATDGGALTLNAGPLTMDIKTHGLIVTRRWTGRMLNGLASNICVQQGRLAVY